MGNRHSWLAGRVLLCVALAAGATGCAAQQYQGIALNAGRAPTVVQQLARHARAGDKRAQMDLGDRFLRGDGVPRDIARARTLYAAAAQPSGGTIWIYSPPVGNEKAGRVIPVQTPVVPGLTEAAVRLGALERAQPIAEMTRVRQ